MKTIIGFILLSGTAFSSLFTDFAIDSSRIETFTFSTNGTIKSGKIYLPDTYETNDNLPAIFLIDFTEQHFKLVADEFEKVIEGIQKIKSRDALVVTLEGIPDIDAEPETFREHFEIYRNLAFYVSGKYTSNTSRTFVGKGSESGIVLMALLLDSPETSVFDNFIATDPSGLYASAIIKMLESDDFPKDKRNKKLHFSFSTSNDQAKCTKIIDLIKEAQLPGLSFEAKEYTNSNYDNTYPVAFSDGIRFVFSK